MNAGADAQEKLMPSSFSSSLDPPLIPPLSMPVTSPKALTHLLRCECRCPGQVRCPVQLLCQIRVCDLHHSQSPRGDGHVYLPAFPLSERRTLGEGSQERCLRELISEGALRTGGPKRALRRGGPERRQWEALRWLCGDPALRGRGEEPSERRSLQATHSACC